MPDEHPQAKALCLTGELIDARRVHELGIVHEVTGDEELIPRALSLGRQLAASPAPAYAATKALLNRSFELSMDEVLQQALFAQSFLPPPASTVPGLIPFCHPTAAIRRQRTEAEWPAASMSSLIPEW